MSEWKERPVYTPVGEPAASDGAPGQVPAPDAADRPAGDGPVPAEPASADASAAEQAAPVRAINEDDDGYDPYSDWHDRGPAGALFEPDPWE